MKQKRIWLTATTIGCIAIFFTIKVVGISEWEKFQIERFGCSTLQDIKAINPKVQICILGQGDYFDNEEAFENKLQTQVELIIRKSGIKVTSASKETQPLHVIILVFGIKIPAESLHPSLHNDIVYAYSCRLTVELSQFVKLKRNPEIEALLRTWPMSSLEGSLLMSFSKEGICKQIEEELSEKMNEFINDYLAANPKEPVKRKQTFEELVKPNR